MMDAAVTWARCYWSFAAASVERLNSRGTVMISFRMLHDPADGLSFHESMSRSLQTMSFQTYVRQRRTSMQVNAAVGYPPSITWWQKGDQPNMREIHSVEEFVDALSKAGDKLVLVDFFSIGCRSCKAIHPKICQIAAENPDLEVLKVNFYDNNALCRSLNVKILPFFHLYRGAEGRLDAFSCSLSKVKKLRDAVAKYKDGCPQITTPLVAKQNNCSLIPTQTLLAALGSTP